MEFKKFSSIENTYRDKEIQYWIDNINNNIPNIQYILTEKIHGTNFSIFISKDEIRYGSRNDFLENNFSFFDWQNTMKKYESDILKFQQYVIENNINQLAIYGELYGKGVMKGVYYSNEHNWHRVYLQ